MKKTRRLLSLIMAAMMLTLYMVTGVWAEDVIITDDVVGFIEPVVVEDEIIVEDIVIDEEIIIDGEGSDDELMPLASGSCTFNWATSHHYQHFENNENKPIHGVFSTQARNSLTTLVPSRARAHFMSGSDYVYIFYFLNAGVEKGYNGSGETLNYIRVVTSGVASYDVKTAYPYNYLG